MNTLPKPVARGLSLSGVVALCLLTVLTLGLGYANKARCTGPD